MTMTSWDVTEETLIQEVISDNLERAGQGIQPGQLRDELIQRINFEISLENMSRGNGFSARPKLRSHSVLPEYAVAMLMLGTGGLGLVLSNRRSYPAEIVVIHKNDDGVPVKIEHGEAAVERVIYDLRPSAKASNIREIFRHLAVRAPKEFNVEVTCQISKVAGGGSYAVDLAPQSARTGFPYDRETYPVSYSTRIFTH
jgi:hypothetical protein